MRGCTNVSVRNHLYLSYKKTEEMEKVVQPISELATQHGFTLVSNPVEANIIASIGGDNAFLQATRKTGFRDDCLYVGISVDSSGFYTDFTIQEIEQVIQAIKNEEVEVRRYPILKVTVDHEKPFYCLNECSIRSNVIKTFVIDVFIDELHFETFRGDGMIVSTPTGSTAYNMSVNGAVVDPTLPSLQVSEIASLNNNDYRTLGTSFLLGANRKLTLKVVQDGNDHPIIGVDNEALSIRHAKEIKMELAERHIKVLKLKHNSFWERVQRKFL